MNCEDLVVDEFYLYKEGGHKIIVQYCGKLIEGFDTYSSIKDTTRYIFRFIQQGKDILDKFEKNEIPILISKLTDKEMTKEL